jgi:uncharacterized protein
MARAFADITFTDSVRSAQTLYHSREFNKRFEDAKDQRNSLGPMDAEFIASRDSFYQASVGENGWPYLQHRGGPVGFLKVLDERTLGYADFSGNRQYISVGNFMADDRVSLFLMDYANRRRLKVWGRVSLVHQHENPQLIAALQDRDYGAPVERAVLIKIEALDWNCSKHITQRYSEQEVRNLLQPLVDENLQLKEQLAQLSAQLKGNQP